METNNKPITRSCGTEWKVHIIESSDLRDPTPYYYVASVEPDGFVNYVLVDPRLPTSRFFWFPKSTMQCVFGITRMGVSNG